MTRRKTSLLEKAYLTLFMILLYAPIVVLMVFSFNSSNSTSVMAGFSLKWYAELFRDGATIAAFRNTVVLAVVSAAFSTVFGLFSAIGINYTRSRWYKSSLLTTTNIPMMNPDIVTGISMMLLFVFAGTLMRRQGVLGFGTMLIAHITFQLPYVILNILPRFRAMDGYLTEAAQDLGCTPLRAFFKVTLPEIAPGILTGAIMAFTMSLDDFVISYFTSGAGFQTLPIRIYSMTKKTVTPKMYALATIIFFVILALLIVSNLTDQDRTKPKKQHRRLNS